MDVNLQNLTFVYNLPMDQIFELMGLFGGKKMATEVPDEYINGEALSVIRDFYRERRYTVKDTGVSYRNISNWKDKGVLPSYFDNIKSQEWTKFTRTELIWLRIVNILRMYGISLEKISEIKNEILHWDAKNNSYLNFEYQLFLSVTTDVDLYLVVPPSGSSMVISIDLISFMKKLFPTQNNSSLLLISLKAIVKEFAFHVVPAKEIVSVTEEELTLLKRIRIEPPKSIKVEMKNGKIFEIETSTIVSRSPKLGDLDKKNTEKEMYGEMIVRYHKGNPESFEIKNRERLG